MLARDSDSELQDRVSVNSSVHSQGNNPSLKREGIPQSQMKLCL